MKKQPILLICAARLFIAKKEDSIPTKISAAEYTKQKTTKVVYQNGFIKA